LALPGGAPVLYEAHDLPTGRLGPLWLRAFLRLPGRKRLVAITHALRRALENRFGRLLADEQVVIAPNGLDLASYQGLPGPVKARRWLNLPEGLTVGCTGHLYSGRGGELFLGLAGRFPGLRFLWVGGRDEDVAAYRAKAERAGLENVTFTGFIPNARLPLYQAAADILLMPYARVIAGSSGGNSADICSPMKLFDYLGAGRAILSSDLPVIHEVLDESSAVFAEPENLEAWTAALARLAGDEPLRTRVSARAGQLAVEYSWVEREKKCLQGL
jgi:glycosyltransferase involved in cell wall biosynthesis